MENDFSYTYESISLQTSNKNQRNTIFFEAIICFKTLYSELSLSRHRLCRQFGYVDIIALVPPSLLYILLGSTPFMSTFLSRHFAYLDIDLNPLGSIFIKIPIRYLDISTRCIAFTDMNYQLDDCYHKLLKSDHGCWCKPLNRHVSSRNFRTLVHDTTCASFISAAAANMEGSKKRKLNVVFLDVKIASIKK